MHEMVDQHYLLNDQYKDASRLKTRLAVMQRLSSNPSDWYRWIFDHFERFPNGRILELGCGPGYLWQRNLDRIPPDWQITLSDFSPGMLREAQQALGNQPQFTFQVIDIQSIPFEAAHFDCVIADFMLYHVPDLQRAFSEIRRVLKPSGIFYAATIEETALADLAGLMKQVGLTPWIDEIGFSLENGTALLSPYFAHVKLERLENKLVVKEAEPLVALIRSGVATNEAREEQFEQLRELINQQLVTQGQIEFSASFGLFIASKA